MNRIRGSSYSYSYFTFDESARVHTRYHCHGPPYIITVGAHAFEFVRFNLENISEPCALLAFESDVDILRNT